MKNYFILILIWLICSVNPTNGQKPDSAKPAILEKIHWKIERSDMITVRKEFKAICDLNHLN